MKKSDSIIKHLRLVSASLFVVSVAVCCTDSDDPRADELSVTPLAQTWGFSASGETFYADGQTADPLFRVATTAAEWSVAVESSWCSAEKDAAAGAFTLRALPCTSETETPPDAVVTVTAGNAEPVSFIVSQQPLRADIYVVGYIYYDSMIRTAACWKNGETTTLVARGVDSYVKQIQVVGDDVYISGGYEDAEAGWVTGYWKNGAFHALPHEGGSEIYEFCVTDAGDVYAVGYDRFEAVCWKNDEVVRLESVISYAYGMWLEDDDLYIVGTRYVKGTGMVGACWKNGELAGEYPGCSFNSVCVNDGRVYLFGSETVESEETGEILDYPFYLVDGERHRLGSKMNNYGILNKIRILDGRIVCTGTDYYFEGLYPEAIDIEYHYACCWIDGVPMRLTPNAGEACGVTSFGGNIYIAGSDFDHMQVLNRAVYWKNGERIPLDDTIEAVACDLCFKVRE